MIKATLELEDFSIRKRILSNDSENMACLNIDQKPSYFSKQPKSDILSNIMHLSADSSPMKQKSRKTSYEELTPQEIQNLKLSINKLSD